MTTATATDYTQYKDKKVALSYTDAPVDGEAGTTVEVEGTVAGANPKALLIKPKGKTNLLMIGVDEPIQGKQLDAGTIKLVEDGDKKIVASKLDLVVLGKARSHLLERHSITLAQANGMTEEQAFEYHSELDHVALDLGHVHVDKAAEKAAAEKAKADKAAAAEPVAPSEPLEF